MTPFTCPVCGRPSEEPVYRSASARSLDSLGRVLPMTTRVHLCEGCGHVTTEPIPDLDRYYAENYRISIGSDEEDQLYEMVDGCPVFRTDHQARLLVELAPVGRGARVLDYGCAKGSTLRKALPRMPGIDLHLFDVSADYQPYWDTLVPRERQSIGSVPPEWRGRFDLVTSFFSLEHILSVRDGVSRIASLLAPSGRFYLVVPDMFANPGDFVVADHVNHFTRASLSRLLRDAGLVVEWTRTDVHRGAIVALASRRVASSSALDAPREDGEVRTLAAYWRDLAARIAVMEVRWPEDTAIYGAGFYGSYIHSSLSRPQSVRCFLDNNPHLQQRSHLGIPVLRPDRCPVDVRAIWIGLNPLHAQRIMNEVNLGDANPERIFLTGRA